MDLLLKGRGANRGARAPSWLVRACGAAMGYMLLAMADRLGLSEITGIPPFISRACALVVGAFVATSSWAGIMWLVSGMLVAFSMVVAFTPIVGVPLAHFIRDDASRDSASRDSASRDDANRHPVDAIIVLSGSMTDDGRLGGPVLDRLLTALAEARKRGTSTIALSVLESGAGARRITSEADQRKLITLLAPGLNVKFVYDVASTHDEAVRFAALANTNGWHRVAVVTSPLHTRRACRTAEVAGLSVTCVPAESREYSVVHLQGPGARMNALRDVLYECIATVVYRARGWI